MLYFGSFNPVHRAHIAIAEHVIERGLADMVVLVVSPQNPFKEADGLAPELERFEMARTAAAASRFPDRIAASAVEMTLPRPSYTIDTLRFLAAERPGVEFSILMGEDNLARLPEWREAEAILGRYPIYVYPRAGELRVTSGELRMTSEELRERGITFLENAPLFEVSSTEVRRLLDSGREHYRRGDFGAAANDFARAREMAPDNTEAAEFLLIIDSILGFRNTDMLNP
jgi:nicotinate-nucleotide adenylyltransferase